MYIDPNICIFLCTPQLKIYKYIACNYKYMHLIYFVEYIKL